MIPQEHRKGINFFLVETDFVTWLQEEIRKRDWDQSNLAVAMQVTPGQVSRVLLGTRGVGRDFIEGVAAAFRIPLERVYVAAGWLPDHGDMLPELHDWNRRLMSIPEERRQEAWRAMDGVLTALESRDRPSGKR